MGISIPKETQKDIEWNFTNEGKGTRKEKPVIGIDIHRDTMVWGIADPMGITDEGMLPNSQKGHKSLIYLCKTSLISMVIMESTAELWLPAYWALHDA